MREIGHFIGGKHVAGTSGRAADVFNPATGEVQAKVSLASVSEIRAAVENAKQAQPKWAATNPQRRARVFMKFVDLLNQNMDEPRRNAVEGTWQDGRGFQGRRHPRPEVCEFVIGIPHLSKGEFTEGAGPQIDMYSMRQPVGIGAGITPFNFPGMIPMWMFAPAIACGNAFILKPSERDPSLPMRLAELMIEAGLPAGILNVVNGDKAAVDAILTDPDIGAISFVGSTPIARYVYGTAAMNGKRAQCFGGAKNHMIIMPDADLDQAVNALMGAGYGSAGERCMAVSVAVPVGEETANRLVEKLIPKIESLRIGPYTDDKADMGPVVTKEAHARINGLIDRGVEEGAKLMVDGRGFKLQGYENGYFVGGTLFDHVTPEMDIYKQEIFGPVLSVVRAHNYEEALSLPMKHEYGNGVAIYTRDGDAARDFASRINIGMIGINVPIPVPLAYHSFGGWKASSFGDLNQHGTDLIKFWTKTKTITARWPSGIKDGAEFVMPTMK
ncbi:CoA-acylating methylmalonate-semialdehyde dehydrogenase [Neorhizobium galegae]|nr:CoA-acylating methylmalonate-semialdehyde dehydrogenase [Neorhizobium galegae]